MHEVNIDIPAIETLEALVEGFADAVMLRGLEFGLDYELGSRDPGFLRRSISIIIFTRDFDGGEDPL
jgi:hypothetical protein